MLKVDKSFNELTLEETRSIEGGLFGLDDLVLAVAAGAVIAIIEDWPNFKAGLTGQPPVN